MVEHVCFIAFPHWLRCQVQVHVVTFAPLELFDNTLPEVMLFDSLHRQHALLAALQSADLIPDSRVI